MTEYIKEEISGTEMEDTWDKAVDNIENKDIESVPNIEDVLSQVRGVARFVGDAEFNELEKKISKEIVDMVDVELPNEEDGSNGYSNLARWLNSEERKEPVEIFTTNYDLLIEQALEKEKIPYFDGFVGGNKPFFHQYSVSNDELPPHWVRLWKIHGSINWSSNKRDESIRIWRTGDVEDDRAVIHPSHKKYDQSRKMPYLTLIDRLKEFLKKDQSVLFTVGYSFGDDHLNDVMIQALRRSPSSAIFAFMYKYLEENQQAKQLAERQSNFSLFARDSGVIGTEVVPWSTCESDDKPEGKMGIEWENENEGEWEEKFILGNFEEYGKFVRSAAGDN